MVSESPRYIGRAVVALAADPKVKSMSGRVFSSWALAREYGFTDLDGTRPHWGNYARKKYGKYKICDARFYSYWVPGLVSRTDVSGLVLIAHMGGRCLRQAQGRLFPPLILISYFLRDDC